MNGLSPLKVEEIQRFEVKREDENINVYLDNELIYSWPVNANVDYPEDLTWGRMISDIFWSGVKVGKML
jgi:hypothetical protein